MMASEVYEFPYSGHRQSSIPFLNYNPNGFSPYNYSSLDGSLYNNSSTFTVPDSRQLFSDLGNNTVVYQVPSDMSLETLLRQVGVDVNSLQRSSSYSNHYTSNSLPVELILPPRRARRRRLICREVSDSSDDDDNYDSRHHRRRRHSSHNEYNQSPSNVHHLLGNAWNKASRATQNTPRGTSMPNTNSQWQGMRNASPPPYSPPPPPPPPPISAEHQNAVNNVWGQAATATKNEPNFLSSFFRRMRSGNTNTGASPPPGPQQNRQAVQSFMAARNVPGGMNQGNNPVANVFGAAQGNAPGGMNQGNNAVANVFGAAQRSAPGGMNQGNNAVANVFGAAQQSAPPMSAPMGPPPQQPYYPPRPPMASMWNQMSGGAPPPPQQPYRPPGPPMASMWNQMSGGAPPQQQFRPPGPPMNPSGYQSQQGYYSPYNTSYGSPPNSGAQPGYSAPSGAAPTAFSAMLSQAR